MIVIVVCELKIENDFEIKKENNNTTNDNLPNLLTSNIDKYKQTVCEDKYISITDLRQTDIDILNILSGNKVENTITILSFNGLKIRLNVHQEKLSRSLKRLKQLELIEKTQTGYKSTITGKKIFSRLFKTKQHTSRKNIQILEMYLPFKVLNKKVVDTIEGRWFGNLRWIGIIQSLTGYQLQWRDIENFIEITLHISDNNIIVETNDNNPLHMSKAFSYSTKIIAWISDIIMRKKLWINSINDMKFNRMQN